MSKEWGWADTYDKFPVNRTSLFSESFDIPWELEIPRRFQEEFCPGLPIYRKENNGAPLSFEIQLDDGQTMRAWVDDEKQYMAEGILWVAGENKGDYRVGNRISRHRVRGWRDFLPESSEGLIGEK